MKNKIIPSNHESFQTPSSQSIPINNNKNSILESFSKKNSVNNLEKKSLNSLKPISSPEQKIYNISDDDDENLGVDQRNRLQAQKQAIKIKHP